MIPAMGSDKVDRIAIVVFLLTVTHIRESFTMPQYLVINCEDSKAWTTAADGGCGIFADMFSTKLSRVGDTWSSVNIAADGDDDKLSLLDDAFDGIVITGSHYNISDNKPWFAS